MPSYKAGQWTIGGSSLCSQLVKLPDDTVLRIPFSFQSLFSPSPERLAFFRLVEGGQDAKPPEGYVHINLQKS